MEASCGILVNLVQRHWEMSLVKSSKTICHNFAHQQFSYNCAPSVLSAVYMWLILSWSRTEVLNPRLIYRSQQLLSFYTESRLSALHNWWQQISDACADQWLVCHKTSLCMNNQWIKFLWKKPQCYPESPTVCRTIGLHHIWCVLCVCVCV